MYFNESKLVMEFEKVESIKTFISKNIENPVESFKKEKSSSRTYLNNISYVEFYAVFHNKYEIKKDLESSLVDFYNKINRESGIETPKEQQFTIKKVFLKNLLSELDIRKITNSLLSKLEQYKYSQLVNNEIAIDSNKLKNILDDVNYFIEIYSLETLINSFEVCVENNLTFSLEHKGFKYFDDLSRDEFYGIIFDNYKEIEPIELFLNRIHQELSSSKSRESKLKLEVLIEFSEILKKYNYKLDYLEK